MQMYRPEWMNQVPAMCHLLKSKTWDSNSTVWWSQSPDAIEKGHICMQPRFTHSCLAAIYSTLFSQKRKKMDVESISLCILKYYMINKWECTQHNRKRGWGQTKNTTSLWHSTAHKHQSTCIYSLNRKHHSLFKTFCSSTTIFYLSNRSHNERGCTERKIKRGGAWSSRGEIRREARRRSAAQPSLPQLILSLERKDVKVGLSKINNSWLKGGGQCLNPSVWFYSFSTQ